MYGNHNLRKRVATELLTELILGKGVHKERWKLKEKGEAFQSGNEWGALHLNNTGIFLNMVYRNNAYSEGIKYQLHSLYA